MSNVILSDVGEVTASLVLLDSEPRQSSLDSYTALSVAAFGLASVLYLGTDSSEFLSDLIESTGLFMGDNQSDFEASLESQMDDFMYRFGRRGPRLDPRIDTRAIVAMALSLPLPIALARQPELEPTHSLGGPLNTLGGSVTAGAVVTHQDQSKLYLTCAHSLPPSGEGDSIGCDCSVDRISESWDAATVRPGCGEATATPNSNVLVHRAPSRGEWGIFYGARSGPTQCAVDGADPILPNYGTGPYGQVARFYTTRSTQPGDSGAVLALGGHEEGIAAGMCVDRTTDGEMLEYSIWMWLAGVMDELDVQLVGWEP